MSFELGQRAKSPRGWGRGRSRGSSKESKGSNSSISSLGSDDSWSETQDEFAQFLRGGSSLGESPSSGDDSGLSMLIGGRVSSPRDARRRSSAGGCGRGLGGLFGGASQDSANGTGSEGESEHDDDGFDVAGVREVHETAQFMPERTEQLHTGQLFRLEYLSLLFLLFDLAADVVFFHVALCSSEFEAFYRFVDVHALLSFGALRNVATTALVAEATVLVLKAWSFTRKREFDTKMEVEWALQMDEATRDEADLQFRQLFYCIGCASDWVGLFALDAPQLFLLFVVTMTLGAVPLVGWLVLATQVVRVVLYTLKHRKKSDKRVSLVAAVSYAVLGAYYASFFYVGHMFFTPGRGDGFGGGGSAGTTSDLFLFVIFTFGIFALGIALVDVALRSVLAVVLPLLFLGAVGLAVAVVVFAAVSADTLVSLGRITFIVGGYVTIACAGMALPEVEGEGRSLIGAWVNTDAIIRKLYRPVLGARRRRRAHANIKTVGGGWWWEHGAEQALKEETLWATIDSMAVGGATQNPKRLEEKYQMQRELGRGAFSIVREATHLKSSRLCAVKSVLKGRCDRRTARRLMEEIAILHLLRGRSVHVVQLRRFYTDPKHCHLVMERCAGGEIFPYLAKRHELMMRWHEGAVRAAAQAEEAGAEAGLATVGAGPAEADSGGSGGSGSGEPSVAATVAPLGMPLARPGAMPPGTLCEREVRLLMRQMGEAIRLCHRLNIVHRDIKPENMLVRHAYPPGAVPAPVPVELVLADFGLAQRLQSKKIHIVNFCGTVAFMAPEMQRNKPHGCPVDMWSLGVVMHLLFTGTFPFPDSRSLLSPLRFSERRWAPVSKEGRDVVRRLLMKKPGQRMTAQQFCSSPWFDDETKVSDEPLKSALAAVRDFDGRTLSRRSVT